MNNEIPYLMILLLLFTKTIAITPYIFSSLRLDLLLQLTAERLDQRKDQLFQASLPSIPYEKLVPRPQAFSFFLAA